MLYHEGRGVKGFWGAATRQSLGLPADLPGEKHAVFHRFGVGEVKQATQLVGSIGFNQFHTALLQYIQQFPLVIELKTAFHSIVPAYTVAMPAPFLNIS